MNAAREPGAKAQIAAGLVALATLALQNILGLAPTDPAMQAMAPVIAYIAAQVVGWLWSRQRTTPTASPSLPAGTPVTLPDGTGAKVVKQ